MKNMPKQNGGFFIWKGEWGSLEKEIPPNTSMFFYELHLHTAETSRCGRSPAADMVKAYYDKGFSGIVVTDHFINGNSYANDPDGWDEKMDVYLRGYQAAKMRATPWASPSISAWNTPIWAATERIICCWA